MNKKELMHSYQKSLIYLGLEDVSAVFLLPEIGGGQDVNENGIWTASVAGFLRANLECGLIEISAGKELIKNSDVPAFLERAYMSLPPEDYPGMWMGIQYSATRKLKDLLDVYGLLNWNSMSGPLNCELMGLIFDGYGIFPKSI